MEMSNSTRIYGRIVDLDGDKVKDFFNKRAISYTENARSRNTTVLLGDNNAEYADQWDSFEKGFILPKLNIQKTDNILDIGCGIGRWAEVLIPICGSYMGVDLSEEMIKVASEIYRNNVNSSFLTLAFQDIFDSDQIVCKKYQAIIITGVSMYLNDPELEVCFEKLCNLLTPGGILYLEESVGIKERLSLNNLWSENLNDFYFAVYRTVDEYKKLLHPLTENADILKEGFFKELDREDLLETGHWFILIKNMLA